MNVTIRYGTDSMNKHCEGGANVGQVINSASVKAQLGFGDNVRALVNGVEQSPSAPVEDGSTIIIETRANSKATQVTGLVMA